MARQLPTILKQWLVLWLDSAGHDLSWNWNTGTLVNTPTKVRVLQNDWLSYNGSSQYITIPDANSLDFWTWDFTINIWADKVSSVASNNETYFSKMTDSWSWSATWINLWLNWAASPQLSFSTWEANANTIVWYTIYWSWAWKMITAIKSWTNLDLYINWFKVATTSWTVRNVNTTTAANVWRYTWDWTWLYSWKSINPMLWNRALSAKEIEMLYYSTFIK